MPPPIAANELKYANENSTKYFIYRVFDYRISPKCFIIPAYKIKEFKLEAVKYRVSST